MQATKIESPNFKQSHQINSAGKVWVHAQELKSATILGQQTIPKTTVEANNVLNNHRFDNDGKYNRTKGNKKQDNGESAENEDEALALSFAQMEGQCYCCGKKGHRLPQCFKKSTILQDEWAINKAQFAQQQENATASASLAELQAPAQEEERR
eukprot:8390379-Ditylum_brightwellii.AAC.1